MKVAARCRGVRCGIGLLAGLVWFGFALLLLTPFIVSEGTIFPYVVGRAVHARFVVAVLVAAWPFWRRAIPGTGSAPRR